MRNNRRASRVDHHPQERQQWKRGPLPQRPDAHRRWLRVYICDGGAERRPGSGWSSTVPLPAGHRVPHAGEPRAGPGHGIRRRGTELRVPRQQGGGHQADRRRRPRAFRRGAGEDDFGSAAIIRANSPGRRGTGSPSSTASSPSTTRTTRWNISSNCCINNRSRPSSTSGPHRPAGTSPTQPQQLRPHRCRQGSRVHLRRRTARRPAGTVGPLHAGGKGGLPGHGHDQRLYRGYRPGRGGKPEVRNRPHVQRERPRHLPLRTPCRSPPPPPRPRRPPRPR